MNSEEQNLSSRGRNDAGESDAAFDVAAGIRYLVESQPYGVLCTQLDGQSYGSMIAFAFTDDLTHAVFSTPRATRKYRNLTECNNVAIVVNDLGSYPDDLMKVSAFTATGEACEISSDEEHARWSALLVERHPGLGNFVESPSTAIFKVELTRFFFVRSFQEVTQWVPSSGSTL